MTVTNSGPGPLVTWADLKDKLRPLKAFAGQDEIALGAAADAVQELLAERGVSIDGPAEQQSDPFACCRNGEHQPESVGAPVVTDEAVMELARALAGTYPTNGQIYDARAALEAAVPMLAPRPALDRGTAIEAAAKARYYENADDDTPQWEEMSEGSHEGWRDGVRVAVDAVLNLLNGDQS